MGLLREAIRQAVPAYLGPGFVVQRMVLGVLADKGVKQLGRGRFAVLPVNVAQVGQILRADQDSVAFASFAAAYDKTLNLVLEDLADLVKRESSGRGGCRHAARLGMRRLGGRGGLAEGAAACSVNSALRTARMYCECGRLPQQCWPCPLSLPSPQPSPFQAPPASHSTPPHTDPLGRPGAPLRARVQFGAAARGCAAGGTGRA